MGAHNPLFVPITGYSTKQSHYIGEVMKDPSTGKKYMFIQVATDLQGDALIAGQVVCLSSASSLIGTNKLANYLDTTNPHPLGIAVNACPESNATDTYYTWIQVGGIASVKTDGGDDIALGDLVVADATVFGAVDILAAATTVTGALLGSLVGKALAADSATAVSVLLSLPYSH